jgi:hypothetical protein
MRGRKRNGTKRGVEKETRENQLIGIHGQFSFSPCFQFALPCCGRGGVVVIIFAFARVTSQVWNVTAPIRGLERVCMQYVCSTYGTVRTAGERE